MLLCSIICFAVSSTVTKQIIVIASFRTKLLLYVSFIIRLAVPFYFPEGNLFYGHAGRERCGINHIMKQQ